MQVYSLEQFFGGRLGILNKNYLAILLNFLDLLKLEMKYCVMFMVVTIYDKGGPYIKFNPRNWCESQIYSARIEIQLKYFVDNKAHLNDLWDGIMVGNSFRESAHLAARAQTQSLIEIHKIIPNFVNDKGNNIITSNNDNK